MTFLSNENLEQIITIFGEYMRDKYNVNIVSFDDNLSNIVLKNMRLIAANAGGGESNKELNIAVLGNLRKYYVGKLQQQASLKQAVRDTEVYGNRNIVFKETVPIDTTIDKKQIDLSKKMEALEARRASDISKPRPPEIDAGIKERAESMEDFLIKVKELEKERDRTYIEVEDVSLREIRGSRTGGSTSSEIDILSSGDNIKSIEFLSGAPSTAAKKAAMSSRQVVNSSQPLPIHTPIINVNKNLKVAKNTLSTLESGNYFIKCLSVKYSNDDFDHIISLKFSGESLVIFKFVDYSLVGDKATVMYEPIVPNDRVVIDSTYEIADTNWLGFSLVVVKPPGF